MIATTAEQGKHLREIGISIDTSDMFYRHDGETLKTRAELISDIKNVEYPAWSLSALLDLLPIKIDEQHYLFIDKDVWGESQIMYSVFYSLPTSVMNSYIGFAADSLIDAAYKMVVWLKENKKI